MRNEERIEEKFWKALKSDATVMLGLEGAEDGESKPMTAQLDGSRGPIWFFTAKNTRMAQAMGPQHRAVIHFESKDHDVFANLHGELVVDQSRARIDRFWNPFVAAWYEGGKNDPQLLLVRFDPAEARIWLNETPLWAGLKILLGQDPKREYGDQVADVDLRAD